MAQVVPAWNRPVQPQEMSEYEYRLYRDSYEHHQAHIVNAASGMNLQRNAREVDTLGKIGVVHRRTRQYKRQEADAEIRNDNARLVRRIMDVAKQGERRIQRAARPPPIAGPESLNENLRRRQAREIDVQNAKLLARLESTKSCVSTAAKCNGLRHPRHARFKQRPAEDGGEPYPPPKPPNAPRPPKPFARRFHPGDAVGSGRGSRASELAVRLPPIAQLPGAGPEHKPRASPEYPPTQFAPSRAIPMPEKKPGKSEKKRAKRVPPAAPSSAVAAPVTAEAPLSFFVTDADELDIAEDIVEPTAPENDIVEDIVDQKPPAQVPEDILEQKASGAGLLPVEEDQVAAVGSKEPKPASETPMGARNENHGESIVNPVTPFSAVSQAPCSAWWKQLQSVDTLEAQGSSGAAAASSALKASMRDESHNRSRDSQDDVLLEQDEDTTGAQEPQSCVFREVPTVVEHHASTRKTQVDATEDTGALGDDECGGEDEFEDDFDEESEDDEEASMTKAAAKDASESKEKEAACSLNHVNETDAQESKCGVQETETQEPECSEGLAEQESEDITDRPPEAARKEIEDHDRESHNDWYASGSVNLENDQEAFPAYSDDEFNSDADESADSRAPRQ